MITLKLWNSLSEVTRKDIVKTSGLSYSKLYEPYHHGFDFDDHGQKLKSLLEMCNLQKDGKINVTVGIVPSYLTVDEIKKQTEKPKKEYTPTGDVNVDILAKWTDLSEKLAYFERLTTVQCNHLKESTVIEMVKSNKKLSGKSHFSLHSRIGNNWNADVEDIGAHKGRAILGFTLYLDNTDSYMDGYWDVFFSGKECRLEYEDRDRYGHPDWHYFTFDNSDRDPVKKEILVSYVKEQINYKNAKKK